MTTALQEGGLEPWRADLAGESLRGIGGCPVKAGAPTESLFAAVFNVGQELSHRVMGMNTYTPNMPAQNGPRPLGL